MYQHRPRRFRRRSNGRDRQLGGEAGQSRLRFGSFSNGQIRNRFNPTQGAEKLFEKYNTLAKEALSSGDKSLSENYFQHADHFMRIIENKNKNRNQDQSKVDGSSKPDVKNKSSTEKNEITQDLDVKEKKE